MSEGQVDKKVFGAPCAMIWVPHNTLAFWPLSAKLLLGGLTISWRAFEGKNLCKIWEQTETVYYEGFEKSKYTYQFSCITCQAR